MSAPLAMRRKEDGRLMPYSETLVAAKPGAYVEAVWDGKSWSDGRPLVALPASPPAQTSTVPPTDGVDKAAPERVELEPDTAAAPARKAKAKASKGAEA